MYTFVSFTAAEPFEKMWQTPMVKLAHDIGVSDVAVAKACRKAGIPLPGRGHWAKPEKQRQRKPKPPQVDGRVRFQLNGTEGEIEASPCFGYGGGCRYYLPRYCQ